MKKPALVCVFAAVLSAGAHASTFVSVSRLSEVTFNGTNLDTGGGAGNDVEITETDPSAPFAQVTQGQAAAEEPGGATNTGLWFVSQSSTISPTLVTSRQVQIAATQTDFGSPVIYTGNDFTYEFEVSADTYIELDGGIVGSSDVADDDFARVQLKQGVATLFNSHWDTFPLVTELLAGQTYTLLVQVSGKSIFNDATQSSAQIELGIVVDTDGDGLLDPFDNCIQVANPTQRDTDGDGFGNFCDPDLTGDGFVGPADFQQMWSVAGTADPDADLDGDGLVAASDLAILIAYAGGPPGP